MAVPVWTHTTQQAGGFKSGAQTIAVPNSGANSAGDVMWIFIYNEELSDSPTVAGFTMLTPEANSNHNWSIGWKRLSGNDTGDYTITYDGSGAWRQASCSRFTGVITTGDPYDVAPDGAASAGSVNASPNTALTTISADNLLVLGACSFEGGTWSPGASGMDERVDSVGIGVYTQPHPTAGPTGNKTVTCTGTAGRMTAWLIALVPAGGASTITGVATANLGALTATAVGDVTRFGVATANLGALTATASGITPQDVTGTAVAAFGFTATAVGAADSPQPYIPSSLVPGVSRFMVNRNPADVALNLTTYTGQRQSTFMYEVVNGRTGIRVGEVYPLQSTIPVLVHNTQNTIVRTLSGLTFGVEDTLSMNPITDRIVVSMLLPAADGTILKMPLGRYMYDGFSEQTSTGGPRSQNSLFDEMFIIDQQLPTAFDGTPSVRNGTFNIPGAIRKLLADLIDAGLVRVEIDDCDFRPVGSWPAGTSRARVLSDLCQQGGYFQPWFDNNGILQIVRAFNPAERLPDFDFDATDVVIRDSITYTHDLLDAPNQYVVINNAGNTDSPAIGIYDIPATAPHSLANRGYLVCDVRDIQADDNGFGMDSIAAAIAQQDTIFERVSLSTPPDPRHDSYDVILWQGQKWLEIAWSMQLEEGAPTIRTLRKAYL